MVEQGLPAISSRQDLSQGERGVENGVKGAVRSVINELSDFDVHQGKRDLRGSLHRLEGRSPVQGVQRGEEDVSACSKALRELLSNYYKVSRLEMSFEKKDIV